MQRNNFLQWNATAHLRHPKCSFYFYAHLFDQPTQHATYPYIYIFCVYFLTGLYWRVQMMDMLNLVHVLLFVMFTALSTWLIAYAYRKVKFSMRHKYVC